jgi:hypothetical protein
MWVQLKVNKAIEIHGDPKRFYAGDWLEIGRQTALKWQAKGECYIPPVEVKRTVSLAPGSSGILVTHGDTQTAKSQLGNLDMQYEMGEPAMPWARTAIWDGQVAIRPALIPLGLQLLDTWEIAVPLVAGEDSHPRLARDEGDEADRQATAAAIGDLRVPVYDTRLLFVRQCEATNRLMAAWKRERAGSERLAFLRALYHTPLLILALPVTWTGA